MSKLLPIVNLIVMVSCCYVLNISITNLHKTTQQILKDRQPEAIRVLDEKYVIAEE